MPIKYLAFFDLDGTIIRTYSASAIVREAVRKGMMGHGAVARAVYLSFLYRFRLRNELNTVTEMMSWLKGAPEKVISDLIDSVCRETLVPSIRKEAVAELEFHRNKNTKIILLSSALSPVCRCIADHLRMDDIICSAPEITGGVYSGRPGGPMCYGKVKAIRLQEYCEKENVDVSDTWYYGDSIADLHVLGIAGHPVCVNPSKKLKKIALSKGWKIVEWN
jgi:HAD superfamily hydrolase (TIGR01490 family)